MEEKKINLIIFPGNFLPNIGGLETHVDEFVKYLSKNETYFITVFSPNVVNGKEKEKIHNNVEVIRYPAVEIVSNFPIPAFWSLKFWKILKELYSNDFNLVMTRTRFFTNSTLGMVFAKFRFKKIKLIHVEHGSEFVKLESRFKSFIAYIYDLIFGKLLFLLADKNIAISQAVYSFIRKNFQKKSDLPIIRRGVDFEIYDKSKDQFDFSKFNGKIKLGFVGRLYKWKGVENTIKAFKKLDDKLQEKSVLIIIGDGEDYNKLESVTGENLNKNIFLLGKVDFKYAISIFKQLDIYVHSAYKGGGLSNSLLQAMYCNCAIVASPNEGANEVVDNTCGFLLENNSIDSLNLGMKELIEDKSKRREYSIKSKEKIKKDFSWNNVVEKYEKVFDEVLK